MTNKELVKKTFGFIYNEIQKIKPKDMPVSRKFDKNEKKLYDYGFKNAVAGISNLIWLYVLDIEEKYKKVNKYNIIGKSVIDELMDEIKKAKSCYEYSKIKNSRIDK